MSTLWFGPTPFVKEAAQLDTEAIDWQNIQSNCHVSKVFVLGFFFFSSDSMACPLLCNTKQFNCFHGCDFCYHKGGKSYPYSQPELPLRNERGHAVSGSVNELQFGVKLFPLMKLSHFQMINAFFREYQHNVCLIGDTQRMSALWFDTANSEAPWYSGKKMEEVDLRLAKIKPHIEITSTPKVNE